MSEGSTYRRLLHLEPLEDRRMLANVTVSNLFDTVNGNTTSIALLIANNGGDGISLREAIMAANTDVDADTINFSVNGTINLSDRPDPELDHLLISNNLTINGPGSILLTIRAYDPNAGIIGNGRRVFEINGSTAGLINVTINDVTISNGDLGADAVGAGIWNRGENLTITDSVISNNRTQHLGGGIGSNSSGTVIINNCTITGNSAGTEEFMYGGGIYAGAPMDGTPGNLFIITSTVSNNSAGGGGGIAALIPATISGGLISGNTAVYQSGGGILAADDLTVSGSTISGNSAVGDGGGVYGLYCAISYSSFSGNSVTGEYSSGGGLRGAGTITSSTINNNTSANVGGGVAGAFTIVNSTVSGNTATAAGGGIYRFDFDPMVIRHSTISGNTAPAGAGSGIASRSYFSGYEVQIQSSIVAGNTNSDIDRVEGIEATIESLGYNLVGSGSGIGAFSAAIGDKIGLNPMLGPLANNGGPTQTRAPLTGSAAIDAGNPFAVGGSGTVPQYDQRNAPNNRVRGARIDIGAFETAPVVPALLGDYNRDSAVNAADYVLWRKTLGTPGLVAYAGADGSGNGAIDTPDRTVWRENFGESTSGSGDSGGEVEGDVDQAIADTMRPAGLVVDPRLGEAQPPVVESLRDANSNVFTTPTFAARNLVNMVWLTLPVDSETPSSDDSAWLNTAMSDDAASDTGLDVLDAVFDSLG